MPAKPRRARLDPRKTPAQSRAAATVDAILEAAAHILERHGFAGYTTNAVAARAGASIGSLYQYFPNKDALTVALIERETAQLLADVDAATGRNDVLDRLIDAAVAHQMRRPVLARLLDFEERRLPVHAREQRVGEKIEAALRGSVPDDVAAADVLAIVRGMIDAAGERGETDAASLTGRVRRAVVGYLAPERRGGPAQRARGR